MATVWPGPHTHVVFLLFPLSLSSQSPCLDFFLRFIREVFVYFCFHFGELKAYFPKAISDSSAELGLGLVSFSSGVQVGRVSTTNLHGLLLNDAGCV